MIQRFSRSWRLIKYSAGVLREDKELLVFPLLSTIAAVLVAVPFIALLVQAGAAPEGGEYEEGSLTYAVMFAMYLAEYFVVFFFNTALVGAAMIRMQGGDPTVRDGLVIAFSKIGVIFGYAMIASTVGVILRALAERLGAIGQFVTGLIGLAWTVATYLAVPVLASRDVGPIEAVKESAALLKKTWGENIISNVGLGFVFGLIYLALAAITVYSFSALSQVETQSWAIGTAVAAVLAIIVTALIQAALQGIFSAALYRYATEGESGAGESDELLRNAFARKR